MIPIDDVALYAESLRILKKAVGGNYRGRAAQIFLACKHYSDAIPRIASPIGIESGELQKLLDDLYSKPSRATEDKVAIIFGDAHKVPSGVTAMGLKGPSNIWRNNLNLQKGFICFATPAKFANPKFRNQSRTLCPHIRPQPQPADSPPTLKDATCALQQAGKGGKAPTYRKDDNPKIFRKDPNTDEYTVYDPDDVAFYAGIVRPTNGNLIPIIALIIALYHDSDLAAGRSQVTINDFLIDFGFSALEAAAYFEDDPASGAHETLRAAMPSLSWQRVLGGASPTSAKLPGKPATSAPTTQKQGAAKSLPLLASLGQTVSPPPPTASGWWSAQQAVRVTLEDAGWSVVDTSAQRGGCDLKITKGATTKAVEVKSSVGRCSPTLTRTEHKRAQQMGSNFILAIVEDYDSSKPAHIQWVEDPASLPLSKRSVTQYGLPRSVWIANTSTHP